MQTKGSFGGVHVSFLEVLKLSHTSDLYIIFIMTQSGPGRRVRQVKILVAKLDHQNFVSRTHMIEGNKGLA